MACVGSGRIGEGLSLLPTRRSLAARRGPGSITGGGPLRSKRSPDGAPAKSGASEDSAFSSHATPGLRARSTLSRLPKKFPAFSSTPSLARLYSPIPSPEGALSGPPGPRGEGAAPAPVGARQAKSPGGERSRSSRGSLTPPLRHYDRSALEAEKAWNGDLQTPCGSAGEARVFNAAPTRRSLTPRPVPDRRPGGG